ncbi:MAG: hypothetical protein R2726_01160 [Acidimicrobiales bacterium]
MTSWLTHGAGQVAPHDEAGQQGVVGRYHHGHHPARLEAEVAGGLSQRPAEVVDGLGDDGPAGAPGLRPGGVDPRQRRMSAASQQGGQVVAHRVVEAVLGPVVGDGGARW